MQTPKISLITVTRNAESTIKRCIESVLSQDYANVEYIVIDGQSTDGTLSIINSYRHGIAYSVSEPDKGIYDAMNKGIKIATGDIVGLLNADDCFADTRVLSEVAEAFTNNEIDAFNILRIHMIDCIASTTADTDDFDDGRFFFGEIKMNHKKWFVLLWCS